MSKKLASIKKKEVKRIRARTRSPVLSCSPPLSLPKTWLYKVVFAERFSLLLVFVLVLSFTLQGIHQAFAEEVVIDIPTESTAEGTGEADLGDIDSAPLSDNTPSDNVLVISEQESENGSEVTEGEEGLGMVEDGESIVATDNNQRELTNDALLSSAEEVVVGDQIQPTVDSGGNFVLYEEEEMSSQNVVGDDNSTTTSEGEGVGGVSTEETETVSEEVSLGVNDGDLLDSGDSSSSSDPDLDNIILSPTPSSSPATTTASSTEDSPEFVAVVNNDSEYNFNANECTRLASGSFYCQEPVTEIVKDGLYALPDADGDLEIYLIKDGVEMQVTSNTVEDAAPYYDQNTDTIVFHRLVEDRYQIFSYSIETGEETQITNGASNNMEPTRQGNYIVWQTWGVNSWDIMLWHDGNKQKITDTVAHDVAPYVHGSLVVWNRHSPSGEKTIEMYDLTNKTYVSINDPEGMSVANPRMVFVYDSLYPNGDIVTKGYDVIKKEFIQLDTLPRPLPEDIPESESTGETRALIQNKPSLKSDEVINELVGGNSAPPEPSLEETATTSTSVVSTSTNLTLDLSLGSTTEQFVSTTVTTDFDLVIPSFSENNISEASTTLNSEQ